VEALDQVDAADVVRAGAAQRLAAAVVLGDSRPEHPRDVPVLHGRCQLLRVDHLVAGKEIAQLLGVLAALVLRPRKAEEALGHHAQRVDGHDRQSDDDQAGWKADRLAQSNETEIHRGLLPPETLPELSSGDKRRQKLHRWTLAVNAAERSAAPPVPQRAAPGCGGPDAFSTA